jgi:hypothetical protein
MSYIPVQLKQEVIKRSGNCCEYCGLHQTFSGFSFHIEHIISEKHDGATTTNNLCLSCPHCNAFKGTDIASNDPLTGNLARLFNPRTQVWNEHFKLNSQTAEIEALTPEGRVTVFLLQLNHAARIPARVILIRKKRYPC